MRHEDASIGSLSEAEQPSGAGDCDVKELGPIQFVPGTG
jgi:hypothetical protein